MNVVLANDSASVEGHPSAKPRSEGEGMHLRN